MVIVTSGGRGTVPHPICRPKVSRTIRGERR